MMHKDMLREIKMAIRSLKSFRPALKTEIKEIVDYYTDEKKECDPDSFFYLTEIKRLDRQQQEDIENKYDEYGNDGFFWIIYADGSSCWATDDEILNGDVTPKMQGIVYAHYQNGDGEFDTWTGNLSWISETDSIQREEYFKQVEINFKTAWGIRHSTDTLQNEEDDLEL